MMGRNRKRSIGGALFSGKLSDEFATNILGIWDKTKSRKWVLLKVALGPGAHDFIILTLKGMEIGEVDRVVYLFGLVAVLSHTSTKKDPGVLEMSLRFERQKQFSREGVEQNGTGTSV
ncbi:hypothetical protein SARC_01311 [Sphaeroforma arctica JP610]|uniref:Uncharacterized protein n=1 Tax=Sphaeroforma arctica JP610 TaxID=667725 RepID=A0A0L0GE54_9EUKA|nr:hypothetical protein SARC_01311 [Sphaeroforma arctica JP610]KNC86538.1 hypothetical protein SARC_01311 [Sphaeroforma arctica JP610]|eukprot:XP_014160440.1 hypothetical protein SARC_01311 [Sphaeroforma arctica JP610]